MTGVYAIRHTRTGQVYVGQGVRICQRWGQHVSMLNAGRHQCEALQAAWDDDGPTAFAFSVLELVEDAEERYAAEARWIKDLSASGLFNERRAPQLTVGAFRRQKGRPSTRGELNVQAKLAARDVREMRALYAAGAASQTELARRFGVNQRTISRIVRGTAWAWEGRQGAEPGR
ncbi:MAG: GIY-YIG nuclease family protein [Chloroflexota bacterium]|nr:GIY-YIG nuclease family protein [Chloroflexota bacterium]